MKKKLILRALQIEDPVKINQAFQLQGWDKPIGQYQQYLSDQAEGIRDVIVAEFQGGFAGYLTIQWEANYLPFKENKIPEIVDFNVLKLFQRRGIGTALMDEAERRIKTVSPLAGIGFGVHQDYGAAQILYVNRNYVPDGKGIVKGSTPLEYGEVVKIDHDLSLHLTKTL